MVSKTAIASTLPLYLHFALNCESLVAVNMMEEYEWTTNALRTKILDMEGKGINLGYFLAQELSGTIFIKYIRRSTWGIALTPASIRKQFETIEHTIISRWPALL